jgi:hypothetical protein
MSEKTNTKNVIQKLILFYNKQGYLSTYGPNIIYFILLIIILIYVIFFTKAMMIRKQLSDNWEEERCKPNIMPFAGLINAPSGESLLDYTNTNYEYCVQNILSSFAGAELEPLSFITNAITEFYLAILSMIQTIREMFNSLRNMLSSIFGEIFSRIINVIIPAEQMIIKMNDAYAKAQMMITTTLYSILAVFYAGVAFVDAFIVLTIIVLTALVVTIFILMVISFFNPAALIILAPIMVTFSVISVALGIIIGIIAELFGVPTYDGIPKQKQPKCFDKDTNLTLFNREKIKISDIKLGDKLHDGSTVNNYIIVERGNEDMYVLNNVVVSGSHSIQHNNRWIKVFEYPNIQKLIDYQHPFLYCINTSSKKINIDNFIYSDWDDVLLEDKYLRLLLNMNIEKSRLDQIHRFYDKGFPSDTKIVLYDGTIKPISDINIGEKLMNRQLPSEPIYVYGKVMMLSDDLFYGNLLDNTTKYTKDLGNFYHLLTNEEYFYVNETKYRDYNSCVDLYLD